MTGSRSEGNETLWCPTCFVENWPPWTFLSDLCLGKLSQADDAEAHPRRYVNHGQSRTRREATRDKLSSLCLCMHLNSTLLRYSERCTRSFRAQSYSKAGRDMISFSHISTTASSRRLEYVVRATNNAVISRIISQNSPEGQRS